MKVLCRHELTHDELNGWAAAKQKTLIFASFYFWNSGDEMQMALAGLYGSILFTTLKLCPELIPVVFPTQWDKLTNETRYILGDLLNESDIKTAFQKLTSHGPFSNHRVCFFIDGLDEYQGHSTEHVQLAKSLRRWAGNEDVKICATSRPHVEFDSLASSPDQIFHLHELTKHDIYLFCRQVF
jgi:hypothetical protein